MYQKRYPSLFNKRQPYINSSQRSVSQPSLPMAPKQVQIAEPPVENKTIIEPEKIEPKKDIVLEQEKVEPQNEEQLPKVKKPTKPRADDKRRKKTDNELREQFMSKLCKSKKLSSSEKTISEINETLEQAEHDPSKLKEIEKETRKKLKILKNSYLFLDKDKKEND